MEKKINEQVDQFLNNFFLTYSKYKDELIQGQKRLVENLSVPLIPISSTICVLPLIGEMDDYRIAMVQEKVLMGIAKLQIQILIMDLSGISEMEADITSKLLRIIDGVSMMGGKTVITGLRPEVVRKMINNGIFRYGRYERDFTASIERLSHCSCKCHWHDSSITQIMYFFSIYISATITLSSYVIFIFQSKCKLCKS